MKYLRNEFFVNEIGILWSYFVYPAFWKWYLVWTGYLVCMLYIKQLEHISFKVEEKWKSFADEQIETIFFLRVKVIKIMIKRFDTIYRAWNYLTMIGSSWRNEEIPRLKSAIVA